MAFRLEVSDHAIMRWLERVYKLDLEEVRAEIHKAAYDAAAAGARSISTQGVTIRIGDRNDGGGGKIVVTVLPCESPGGAMEGMARAKGGGGSRQEFGKWSRRMARGLKG